LLTNQGKSRKVEEKRGSGSPLILFLSGFRTSWLVTSKQGRSVAGQTQKPPGGGRKGVWLTCDWGCGPRLGGQACGNRKNWAGRLAGGKRARLVQLPSYNGKEIKRGEGSPMYL
jgi:hypothetical protein